MKKYFLSILLGIAILFSSAIAVHAADESASEDSCNHSYSACVCIYCGHSVQSSTWMKPDLADSDYMIVAIPDPQWLVDGHPEAYYKMIQWIVDKKEKYNIIGVMVLGDMTDDNTTTQWTISKRGMDILNASGIPWMPMRGNHDNSTSFNRYYDYATYGPGQSWFGGSYEEGKLDHTYWYITAESRDYLVLSLGWAPSWDVVAWAEEIVQANPDKNVILTAHAYMNKDGYFLEAGDSASVATYGFENYPEGYDLWNTFSKYDNLVLGLGGHIIYDDISRYVGKNAAGNSVYSMLIDGQGMDIENYYGMLGLFSFNNNSNSVKFNYYCTRYDALFKYKNQFSITVPHAHTHEYASVVTAPTCSEQGYTTHSCNGCDKSFVDSYTSPAHSLVTDPAVTPTCTVDGLSEGSRCQVCKVVITAQEVISAPGHTPGAPVEENRREATYTTAGSYDIVVRCSVCRNEISRESIEIPPLSLTITRISGKGRCETAIKAADTLKEKLGVNEFDTIIIASGDNFADALAGSYLAAKKDAPILLYQASSVELNKSYILENLSEDGIVYLLGGTAAVPEEVEEGLKEAGIIVERLFGKTRFETNLKILEEAGVDPGQEILVCTGYNFADSLSASATGLPILMVDSNKNTLTDDQKAFLASMSGSKITIIGGTGAVSDALMTALQDYGNVERLSGKTRYETSTLIAKTYFEDVSTVVIAYGNNFPDGLCGGPLAYAMGAPLVLTAANSETAAAAYVDENPVTASYVLGGTAALSDETVTKIFE